MRSTRQVAARRLRALRRAPLAAMLGVSLLPVLHYLARRRWLRIGRLAHCLVPHPATDAPTPSQLARARELASALDHGARWWRLQHRSCLVRSAMLWVLCQRAGIACEMRIGVLADDARRFHAWVESAQTVVNDTDSVRRHYRVLDKPYLP